MDIIDTRRRIWCRWQDDRSHYMTNRTKHLTLSGLFISLGILIPILFHAMGLGSVFLPMFLPIAACGFFLPLTYAMAVGVLTPILSMMVTGMPPPPILYKMILELGFLAAVTGFLYKKSHLGIFWLILCGLFAAEVMGLLGSAAIAHIFGLPPELYALVSLVKGIPGMILLLTVLPLAIHKIKSDPIWRARKVHVKSA